MCADRNYNKMRTFTMSTFPPTSLPPCYTFPGGIWTLPPSCLCSYCLISSLSSQKEDTMFSLLFFYLSFSPESSLVRHWCPQNCPHQRHQGLSVLCSIACSSSSSSVTGSWPVLPFAHVFWNFYSCSAQLHSIPFIPPHSTHSTQLVPWHPRLSPSLWASF